MLEVVTVCDHLSFLLRVELKHKVAWKAQRIAFNRLIKDLGGYAVQLGQICVNHHTQPAHHGNASPMLYRAGNGSARLADGVDFIRVRFAKFR